jgi:DNA-binding MarR family transcriptional regulator
MNHPVRARHRRESGDASVRDPLRSRSLVKSAKPPDLSEADWRRENLLASVLQTGMHLQASLDKSFSRHGLTMLDASVLLRCVEARIVLTPGKLAVALGRDKGSITRVVDRLEKKCFVTRVAGRHDRRTWLLKPTNRAKKIAPTLRALFNGLRRQLFTEILESDLDHLTHSLARLRKNAAVVGRGSIAAPDPPIWSPRGGAIQYPTSGTSKQVRGRKLFEPMQNL